jgi:hypothetical protein
MREHRASRAATEHLVLQEILACQDSRADHPQSAKTKLLLPADRARKAIREIQDHQDSRDNQGNQDNRATQEIRPTQDFQDLKDHQDRRDRPDPLDPKATLEFRLRAYREHRDCQDDRELQVPQDRVETQAAQEIQDSPATQAHQDPQAIQAPPDNLATQETTADKALQGLPANAVSARNTAPETVAFSSKTVPSEDRRRYQMSYRFPNRPADPASIILSFSIFSVSKSQIA